MTRRAATRFRTTSSLLFSVVLFAVAVCSPATVRAGRGVAAVAAPNDTYWPRQANLGTSATFGIDLLRAWSYSRGSGVVIAVVDTGYVSHPDLASRLLPGYDFISNVARARDGDGRDADPTDEGDWVSASDKSRGLVDRECDVEASSWHGTSVASVAMASANNSRGLAGIAPKAKLVPVRALGPCGGTDEDIADAITWASGGTVSGVPANKNPADIINLSLTGEGGCEPPLAGAIAAAIERGSMIVVAAGNDGSDASNVAPANCDGVVTVAATSSTGRLTAYSNFGWVVDIAAPGGVESKGIIAASNRGASRAGTSAYAQVTGTSFAAPHVAGILALATSFDRTTPADALLTLLYATATPFADGCAADRCGAGIASAGAMLTAMSVRPKPIVVFDVPERLAIGLDGGESALLSSSARAANGTELEVKLSVATTSACTIVDGMITALTAATCRIRASVDGGLDTAPTVIERTIEQVGLSAALSIRAAAKMRIGTRIAAVVGATSPGAWKLKSLTPKTCTIIGRRTIVARAAGTCSVRAAIPVAGPYESATRTIRVIVTR